MVEPGEALTTAIKMAKQINKSPDFAVSQLIQVSNIFFDQVKAFEAELQTVENSMKSL